MCVPVPLSLCVCACPCVCVCRAVTAHLTGLHSAIKMLCGKLAVVKEQMDQIAAAAAAGVFVCWRGGADNCVCLGGGCGDSSWVVAYRVHRVRYVCSRQEREGGPEGVTAG